MATAICGVPPKAEKANFMYHVYILESLTSKRKYIGVTSDINKRIRHHNTGVNISTRKRGPWKLIYSEEYQDKKSAWLRERMIKSYKGGNAFKRLLFGEV